MRTLPFLEQQPLYNAVNMNAPAAVTSDYRSQTPSFANLTIAGVGLSTLWCPSDPAAMTVVNLAAPNSYGSAIGFEWYGTLPPGVWNQYSTSYVVNAGPFATWGNMPYGMATDIYRVNPPPLNGQVVTVASVTDGLSNTVFYSEQTMSILPQNLQTPATTQYPYWNLGNAEMCIFDSEYPPNPQRYMPANSFWLQTYVSNIASSRHPGGVNCAFSDGSVKFIKDSINSWPNTAAGSAYGSYGCPSSYYTRGANGVITMNPGASPASGRPSRPRAGRGRHLGLVLNPEGHAGSKELSIAVSNQARCEPGDSSPGAAG